MYVIIETGGKQYKVAKDDEIFVEKLAAEADETVTIDKVLAYSDGKKLKIGTPYLSDVTVTAKVVKNGKAKKITVMTYKPKKNEKRKMGHRQPYTKLVMTDITKATRTRAKKDEAPAEAEA